MVHGSAASDDPDSRHVNRTELSGSADLVQARDVHGGVHFHGLDPAPADPPPRQLPGGVAGFLNRNRELSALDRLLTDAHDTAPTVTLLVVAGTAGVGKTSLAIRWAHRVKARYPDGQLYVNLRGYDPGPPVDPAEALDRFLRSLGVPPPAIPADLDERAAMYRSRLADRRILVVLDNAASVGQVRPLLPGTDTCSVIVTSRSRLSALVARDGGQRLTLDILPEHDAVELLRTVMDGYRQGDSEEELVELARLCARLPLALRIAGERAASRPFMALHELIQDLRDESALWDTLTADDGDESGAVRTVFAWSYRALTDEAARLFRLLGLHPGPDFSAAAAVVLSGTPARRIRHLLDQLVGAHLLEHVGLDRYQLHDLLRAYAIDQVRQRESDDERQAAQLRVLRWYLHSADAAVTAMLPFNQTVPLDPAEDVEAIVFSASTTAAEWFETERHNLVAATRLASECGAHQVAWHLAAVLRGVYMHQNAFDEWSTTARIGLASARSVGDRRGEAETLESLGKAHFQARQLDEAAECHQAALAIRREIGDEFGTAVSINALGLLGLRHRRLTDSVRYFSEALEIVTRLGNRRWRALALSNLGETRYEMLQLPEAAELLRKALAELRDLGDRGQEGNALFFLSRAERETGDVASAQAHIETAVAIAEEANNSLWLGHWLVELARVRRAIGDPAAALDILHRAAALQRRIGDRSREATAIDGAGEAYQDLGRPAEAVDFHRQAAGVHRRLGDSWQTAVALHNLATALAATSSKAEALPVRQEALTLLSQFEDDRAANLRRLIQQA
ncbi:tetratricopeptide repeat protein [Solwaraspora sp. WMMD792]|uniref:ATP-binding protein n=1 Tax=Solwaraspora sp. WMMD792 TaxID=3016099 RepID=UPI002416543B|nr:tetratricopeptide repeat protein [Solwaraspora sp. WMMD792]MDG4773901.1 tetratricopeptide repeat protein [Solwaraspora sp. WMMD792]